MKLIIIIVLLNATATALGQLSNVQNQHLQYDIGTRLEHRRMILATLAKIKQIKSYYRRQRAMHGLRAIVRNLQRQYDAEDSAIAKREKYRRKMYRSRF